MGFFIKGDTRSLIIAHMESSMKISTGIHSSTLTSTPICRLCLNSPACADNGFNGDSREV